MEPDFGGWATKANLRCTDGRVIMPGAFQHMDKMQVPLVYQHTHNNPENVLGHAVLENRKDGVYAYGYFNNTKQGQNAKELVAHRDLKSLSIYANGLVENNKSVTHGMIREVSLVLAGANPGAVIDFVNIKHGDGSITELEDEAVIKMGIDLDLSEELSHGVDDEEESDEEDETDDEELEHAVTEDTSVADVYNSMTPEQQNVVQFFVGAALADAAGQTDAKHSALTHSEGGVDMTRNVFDQTAADEKGGSLKHTVTAEDVKGIFADAAKMGSLKAAAEKYAEDHLEHGITDIDILFPDAKAATGVIELEKRRTEWVSTVLNGTRHTPFSRIKTFTADLTQDEARAKGYIKGHYKREEWFGVSKRTTDPTTIYKKQKLDRDDILDITDFDIVAFLKGEMRLMTEEEFARAVLIGDGRDVADEDKVKDPMGASSGAGIRSIYNDHELFVTTLFVNVDDADSDYEEVVDAVMDGFEFYKGTGTPTFFTTVPQLNMFLKAKDGMGRRIYADKSQVAAALGVSSIVTVEPMKEISDLIGIIVNLDDYNVGTDRGGELTMFDDFDIDYNQYKYLMETRASGALVRPKAALVIKKVAASDVKATPQQPSFNSGTGVITIPTVTGVDYKEEDGTVLSPGAQPALGAGESTTVYAEPKSGYYFASTAQDSWEFKRPAA